MVADGGTSKTGVQHHYYICKKRRGGKCDKKRENKDNLELYVTACVKEFLSNPENAETAVNDVLAYYDKRTDEQNLKSITAKIAKIRQEVSELTDAFIKAKSVLLQNSIETKMAEYEVLLNDLETQKAQLELERGYKLTKKDLLVFIEELLKGDVNDNDYQKQIIDHLVSQVFVSDDNTVVYFNIRGGKDIEKLTIDDTKEVVKKVQTQSPLARQEEIIRTPRQIRGSYYSFLTIISVSESNYEYLRQQPGENNRSAFSIPKTTYGCKKQQRHNFFSRHDHHGFTPFFRLSSLPLYSTA